MVLLNVSGALLLRIHQPECKDKDL